MVEQVVLGGAGVLDVGVDASVLVLIVSPVQEVESVVAHRPQLREMCGLDQDPPQMLTKIQSQGAGLGHATWHNIAFGALSAVWPHLPGGAPRSVCGGDCGALVCGTLLCCCEKEHSLFFTGVN